MTPDRTTERRWFWGMMALLIMVRGVAILIYPGTSFPDYHLYVAYADIILNGTDWLHHLEVDPLPVTGFRALGYPLILAGARWVAGAEFIWLIQCLQAAVTLLACAILFRALQALLRSPALAALSVLGFGLSVNLAYEMSLLPDSLLISTWVLLVAVGTLHWLIQRPITPTMGLALGLMALLIVMMRGNGIHLLLLTAPIIGLACLQPGLRPTRRAIAMLLVYLPGFVAYQAVSEWNQYRTGERFFTTGAQIALVQPVFRMARNGATPFDGDDPLSLTLREKAPDLLYEQIYEVNRSLFIDHGMTAKQIADANIGLYLKTVAGFPAAFAKMFVSNFDQKLAIGMVNPAFGLHEAHFLATGERLYPGFSKIIKQQQGGLSALPYAALYAIGMGLSIVLFLSALLIAPIHAWRQRFDRQAVTVAALWLVSLAGLAYYSALFMELRYVIMITPFLNAVGFWALHRWPPHSKQ